MCCTSGVIASSDSGRGARNAADPPRGTLTTPRSSRAFPPSAPCAAATHAVNRSSAIPTLPAIPRPSSTSSSRPPNVVPRVLLDTSQYIARWAALAPTRPPLSTTADTPSSASASARTVSRSSAPSAATTRTSGDANRAALAVMPSRTPTVHAAREHARTIGLCRASDARTPTAGSCPAPTTATAAPRNDGSTRPRLWSANCGT